ncbi:AraC family transcriptional regulator [Deminuibacter soli]|uniref:AraC family transcriptional regulator n=1 Tax=Deminuibacter soli TaxID=2291815 RepID=A0A3E1NIS9_9BACT|nr:AraC family transcriptional regulator [Deminuibacter soli]RFM27845.1 AraC family transcriptional regulator [Deminuibacter soli]
MQGAKEQERSGLLYNCYTERWHSTEQFVAEHAFSRIISGELHLFLDGQTKVLKTGDTYLVRRNQLAKATKLPALDGDFKSITIYLTQEPLRAFSIKHQITQQAVYNDNTLLVIPDNAFINSFFQSLLPYFNEQSAINNELIETKTTEAILLLQKICPDKCDWLFDFREPGKIDLEAFMQQNYMFNVSIPRFAQLTGRSLAAFKRDFEKVFHSSPSRWLQHRRLSEAHYLIKEKGRKPASVYLEVGFEDLSHFSFAFKKQFGYNASTVA